jgi:hypothetical protein
VSKLGCPTVNRITSGAGGAKNVANPLPIWEKAEFRFGKLIPRSMNRAIQHSNEPAIEYQDCA